MSNTPPTNLAASTSPEVGKSLAVAIAVLAGIVAGVIHFSLVSDEFNKGATGYGTAFVLTGVATFIGLIVGYAPATGLAFLRTPARIGLILLSVGSIVTYLALGYFDTLGWVTKAIEAVLVAAVAATVAAPKQ